MSVDTQNLGEAAQILTGLAKSEEPETAETDETEHDTGEGLLATHDEGDISSDADDAPAEMPKSYSVKDLAERLGVRPQDVYASLQIDVGGESLPIGEYKDRAKELKRADKILADAQDAKAEFERDYLVKQQALNQREAGKQLSEQEIRQFEEQRNQAMQLEAQKIVQVRPELADADENTKASQRITDLLGQYGIAPWEAEQLYDARLTLAFLRLADLEDRLQAAKDSEVKHKRKQRPKGESREAVANRGQKAVKDYKSGQISQTDAVRQLLTG